MRWDLKMGDGQLGRGSKYADDFKRLLVAESRADGVTVPMVSARHGVPTSRIYSWRSDPQFQSSVPEAAAFTPIEISTGDELEPSQNDIPPSARIEITLENGRKLSLIGGVDAGFVLELVRGLAA
jgi:transposase